MEHNDDFHFYKMVDNDVRKTLELAIKDRLASSFFKVSEMDYDLQSILSFTLSSPIHFFQLSNIPAGADEVVYSSGNINGFVDFLEPDASSNPLFQSQNIILVEIDLDLSELVLLDEIPLYLISKKSFSKIVSTFSLSARNDVVSSKKKIC